jgi:RNA polymerase sigma factor (sigma-70 family)
MDNLPDSDAELVRMSLGGNHDAYKKLVTRYQGHVYGLAYSLVSSWADAQDITQETFIRAYTNLDQLEDAGRFAAWLRRVTFGVAMNWLRTFRPKLFHKIEGRVDMDSLEIPDFQPGPPEALEKRELANAVLAAVASLPAKYRVPLTMFHLDGLSYQKVADFLDIPLGTAKSMIRRAKEKLRAILPAAIAKEVTNMAVEVFNEYKLPADFAKIIDDRTDRWWHSVAEAQGQAGATRATESGLLQVMKLQLEQIPQWAWQVTAQVPTWGFESCVHRWLDGLDELAEMIGTERWHVRSMGNCGDVPARVAEQAERRASAVEHWLSNPGRPVSDLDRQMADWLGHPTPAKKEAARCFIELVRAFFFRPKQEARAIAARWREHASEDEILSRLFYGDGLDRGLESSCGFRTIARLETFIRMIGGDDSELEETRWVCNTQLRYVLRDDPERVAVTRGYLWGLYACLAGHDEGWLRENHEDCVGAAVRTLRRVSSSSDRSPVRRWVVGSLLSATKFWYLQMLNRAGRDNAPGYASDVPALDAELLGVPEPSVYMAQAKSRPNLAKGVDLSRLRAALVAEYLFNGDAKDSSGRGHHGKVIDAVLTDDRFGRSGLAYAFDGERSHIVVVPPPELSTETLAVSAWVRYDDGKLDGWTNAIVAQDSGAEDGAGRVFQLSTSDGRITWHRMNEEPDLASLSAVQPLTWYHVVVQTAGDQHELYIDGVRHDLQTVRYEDTLPRRYRTSRTEPLYIGRKGTQERFFFFHGAIDDVRIFNRALTEEEIVGLLKEDIGG